VSSSCAASKKCCKDEKRRARSPAAVSKSPITKTVVCNVVIKWCRISKGRQGGCAEQGAMPTPHCFNSGGMKLFVREVLGLVVRHTPVARGRAFLHYFGLNTNRGVKI
jgi:hypothetical protein